MSSDMMMMMSSGMSLSNMVTNLLFSGWNTTNSLEYWNAIGVVFIAAVYTEFLSFCKRKIVMRAAKHNRKGLNHLKYKLATAFFYVLHLWFHYMLMLVVMTFNAGLLITVLAGAALGYLLFMNEFRFTLQECPESSENTSDPLNPKIGVEMRTLPPPEIETCGAC
eukprot:Phypoly_transcript_20494.p1 GENE.Phypoly_transcript_20494~~Phypoly_transcript_20494.p1  ORF type:complete len:188 (+),score=24.87 Phypoly_transcript_20494:72-566(+)